MRIGLIALSGVRVRNPDLASLGLTLPGFVRRGRVIATLPSLGLLTVAALTPPQHEITYLEIPDSRAINLPSDLRGNSRSVLPDFDLVGVSSLTAQIDEAYAIADDYRARGAKVVLGGLHVSALPSEAAQHADAVVTGGAEDAWPQIVADAEAGRLRAMYSGARDNLFTQSQPLVPRFDLLAGRSYNRITVQTSRGCPRDCEFCAASPRITDRFQQKRVSAVLAEIREAKRHTKLPFFELADDNTFLNKAWSREFLKAVAMENIRWFTETDVSVAEDLDLCDRLADSGCRQVLIGFESPRARDLAGLDPAEWKQRMAPRYRQAIDVLQSRGVSVNGCFVLGLDSHTPDVFPEVLDFVRSSGLAEAQYTVLTPFPGTPLYTRLHRQRRLLAERFWDRCTLFDVNFEPTHMTVEELETGLRWLMRETYSGSETSLRLRRFMTRRQAFLSNGPPSQTRGSTSAGTIATASTFANENTLEP